MLVHQVDAAVDAHAPGFAKSVIARQIHSPLDLERRFGLIGGDIFHGKMGSDQLFSARPMIGASNYRMPLPGLYLCGSGAHPGGGVTGNGVPATSGINILNNNSVGGVAVDAALFYAKGGYAWANNKLSVTAPGVTASDSHIHSGYTIGGGLEYMFAPNWSAKAEYQYYNFGDSRFVVPAALAPYAPRLVMPLVAARGRAGSKALRPLPSALRGGDSSSFFVMG